MIEYGYIVYYDRGYHIEKIKLSDFKTMHKGSICRYRPDGHIGFYGSIYNDRIFLTEADAQKDVNREFAKFYTLDELLNGGDKNEMCALR